MFYYKLLLSSSCKSYDSTNIIVSSLLAVFTNTITIIGLRKLLMFKKYPKSKPIAKMIWQG
jgi:hypothetical protein